MVNDIPDYIRAELESYLNDVKAIPGFDNAKVTLVIRSPDIPGGDIVMSDDDLDQVVGCLMRDEALL